MQSERHAELVEASPPLRCTGSNEAVEMLQLRGRQMSMTVSE